MKWDNKQLSQQRTFVKLCLLVCLALAFILLAFFTTPAGAQVNPVKLVPLGQEAGEEHLFSLNRNDFYGNTWDQNLTIQTVYSQWQDLESHELVIQTLA